MSKDLFIPASFFMVRAPVWPIEMYERFILQENWLENLMTFYDANEILREAVFLASPSLYRSLNDHSQREYKEGQPTKKYKNLGASLLNYALRMATRTTPFGLFSFVAKGSWGAHNFLEVDLEKIRKRTRPDMEWLDAYIHKFYHDKEYFFLLPVYLNPLVHYSSERFFLKYLRQRDAEVHKPSKTSSIKSSKLINLIFTCAQEPIAVNQLLEKIKADFPDANEEKITGVVQNLLSNQFLLSNLLPSLLTLAPFQDLLARLPAAAPLKTLKKLEHQIKLYDDYTFGQGEERLIQLQKGMANMAETPLYLQSDSYYAGQSLTLTKSIAKEVTKAVSFVWKLGTLNTRPSGLDEYHKKFIEKYGFERTVPLLELLSEEKGLGSFYNPDTSPKPVLSQSSFTQTWKQWLDSAWQDSLRQKRMEIVLSESLIDHLLTLSKEKAPSHHDALNSFDVFFKIFGDSPEDIDQGRFTLQYCQASWQGTSAFGRFLDIFGSETQSQVRYFLQKEEQLESQVLFVELAHIPKSMRYANIATYPCFRAYRLDLGSQKREEGTLTLDDIYVGATLDRFYLTLKKGQVEINACTGSMINPTVAPDAFQFMFDVTNYKYRLLYNFSWGERHDSVNFLPRIRFKKTIISPAKWNILGAHFLKKPFDKVKAEFNSWADQWNLPTRCLMQRHDDQHLLIDRTHQAHLNMIARKLIQGESLHFIEHLGNSVLKSQQGYHSSEIVIPFLKNPVYARKTTEFVPPEYVPVSVESRWKFPASEWVYLKFYLPREIEDFFLLSHLAPFTEYVCQKLKNSMWFFLRYSDPETHLRLRIRLDNPQDSYQIMSSFEAMYNQWMETGLIKNVLLATYEREIERYGGFHMIDAAESVFCADTKEVIDLLTSLKGKILHPKAVTHGLSLINLLIDFNLDVDEMLLILGDGSSNTSRVNRSTEHKKQLVLLLKEQEAYLDKSFFVKRETEEHASNLRLQAARTFQKQAKCEGLQQSTLRDIYRSILHMHCNRLGCTFEDEREAIWCARDALSELKWRKEANKVLSVA